MVRESLSLVLDTNVWLDAFLPARPSHDAARELLSLAVKADANLLYPIHIAPDVFYLTFASTKAMLKTKWSDQDEAVAGASRTTAWDVVNTMREVATAVGAEQADMWQACKMEHLHHDLEDNLVLVAALRAKADYLVTSDKRLLAHAPLVEVVALTPEDMLLVLEGRQA